PRSLDAFEALVALASADSHRRERAQAALSAIHDPSGYYLHRLTHPNTLHRQWRHIIFPLWVSTVLVLLALAVFWPTLLFLAVLLLVVNFVVRISTARRISAEATWFRQVGPLLSAARVLMMMDSAETNAITGSLKSDLNALKRLGAIARWVSRDPIN